MIDRLWFFLRHSLNDLKVNKQRTLFALLCIAAGVAAIVSLQTLAVMMDKTLTGSLQETNRGDLSVIPNNRWGQYIIELDEDEITMGGNHVFTPEGIAEVQSWLDSNYPGSKVTYRQAVAGFGVAMSASIPERGSYKPFVYNLIIDADEYPLYGKVETEGGTPLAELLGAPTDIVISQNLADDLGAEVGDTLRLSGASEDFTITGIVPTNSEAGFMNFVATLFGYFYLDHSSTALFKDLTPGQAASLYIRLGDPSQVDEAARRLNAMSSYSTDITTTTELKDMNEQVSSAIGDLVVVMGLVSLLIGGIGIVNTMLVIVSRRTTEVAVLKTLGLEPHEVIILFLVEAILMGIAGSLLGVLGGWGLAYLTKGVAEGFLSQTLVFTPALRPALNGIVVGIVITAIFGFLPTLAAGQIRPANVLRPSDTVIPQAGRLSAFATTVVLIMALSLVAQGLLAGLLGDAEISGVRVTTLTTALGAVYGVLIAVPLVLGDIQSMRRRRRSRSWPLHALLWLALLIALPVAGAAFGAAVPAIIVLTVIVLLVGYTYIALWLVIWAVGGGRISEIWPGILALLFPLFWPLIPVLIVLLIPTWIVGWLIQRYTFIDFKIAMRSMLATKGRGASTLLALVVGVFTLSVITMLVASITTAFENLLEDVTGGNIMIMSVGGREALDDIRDQLQTEDAGVKSFAMIGSYPIRLVDYWDASAGRNLTDGQRRALGQWFDTIDGRELTSNLPELVFSAGRNLDSALDSQPAEDGSWPMVVTAGEHLFNHEFAVGDRLTFAMAGSADDTLTFTIVGVAEESGVTVQMSDSRLFAPLNAFEEYDAQGVYAIADVEEDRIRDLRRSLAQIPGAFVLETRFLNDLINRVVRQFTSFPILVAGLALLTGGVVIANAVALSTLERRREIGVMKAIGLQRERVLGMLLLENGLMGLVGGLIGVGISFIALVLMLTQMFGGELGNAIPYSTAFTLMALCIGIALVAALLSVWGASGEKPLNILRYE